MTVQESDDVALGAEQHIAVEPAKGKDISPSGGFDALGAIGNALPERPERLGNLHCDRPRIVFAQSRQMWTRPIA